MKTRIRINTLTVGTALALTLAAGRGAPGEVDSAFGPPTSANAEVFSTSVQPDGKIVIGGKFSEVNGDSHVGVARLQVDGTLDTGFNATVEGLTYVNCTAVQADGKILLGGNFTTVNGVTRNFVGRLNDDGSLDNSFTPSVNAFVYSVAVQADQKILIAGDFSDVNGSSRSRIARLNPDGTLDEDFNPGVFIDGSVYTLALQLDGKILIGGAFSNVGLDAHRGIARLSDTGLLDPAFDPGLGGSDIVFCVAVQPDGKILIGGAISSVAAVTVNKIARLSVLGTLDGDFDTSVGPENSVYSLALQTDGKIVIGGPFTSIGMSSRGGIARLDDDGTLDNSFNLASGAGGTVNSLAIQADGSVVIGGLFSSAGGNIARLLNDSATHSLTVPSTSQILWIRGGASPEAVDVTFEYSVDGSSWSAVGAGTRTVDGWERTGLTLASTGFIRARGRTIGGVVNGSAGLVAEITSYNFTPTAGSITVVLDALPDDQQDFLFNRNFGPPFPLDDDAEPTLLPTVTFTALSPGDYTITQLTPPGWDLSSLGIAGDSNGDSTILNTTANLKLAAGENIVVTFANKKRGSIQVVINVNPDDPQDFHFTRNFGGDFDLDDDAEPTLPNTTTFDVAGGGNYSITLFAQAGWDFAVVGYSGGDLDEHTDFIPGVSATANIPVDPGENNLVVFNVVERFRVKTSTPAANANLTVPPSEFIVNFSYNYNGATVDASDLKVDGISADAFTLVDGDTISFTFNTVPATTLGTHSISMAVNSVARGSDNTALDAFASDFEILPAIIGPPTANLALWLKADAGVVTASPEVTQWQDQSGNNRHAAQAVNANRPMLVPSTLNGLPVVHFDGANDFMTFPLSVNGLAGMTIFLVAANEPAQNGGSSQAKHAALFWNETQTWGTVYLSPYQSTINFRFGTTQVGNRTIYQRPASVGNTFTLSTAIKDGGTEHLYVNGALVVSQSGKLSPIAACQSTGNLGRGYGNNTFYSGSIAEVLVYSAALSDTDRAQVESYLDNKYALTAVPTPLPPEITQHPASVSVVQPSPATFTVAATGTLPITYQWRTNGLPVPGATNTTFTIDPTSQANHNGLLIDVQVHNIAGDVASAVATLTVTGGGLPSANLALWLKADAGVITSSPGVTQWSDQSGNNRHATQGTLANRPTLVPSVLNGSPILRFDGVNDFLTFNLGVNGLSGMSIFLVAANSQNQSVGGSQAERAAVFWNESQTWGTVYLSPFQNSVAMRFGTRQINNRILYNRPSPMGSAFSLSTAIKNGTTDQLYVNGQLAVSQSGKLTTIAGCQATGNVGRGYNNNTYYAGDIAEILVYTRAVSTAERALIEQYLDGKYSLTLPAAPQITQQPASAIVVAPQAVAFTVTATGSAPLTYQWRSNSIPIAGATASTYVLNPTPLSANGAVFDVVVSNPVDSVTSQPATLTVLANPPGSGLALWLKADAGPILSGGSSVTSWNDQSGQGHHASQAGLSRRPILQAAALNGFPVVRFDGVDDFLSFDLSVNGLTGMSIFLVAANGQNQAGGNTQAERATLFWNETAFWGTVYLTSFQNTVNARFGTTQAGNRMLYTRPAPVGGAFTLSSAIKDQSNDSLYVNRTLVVSQGSKLTAIAGCSNTGNLGRGYNDNTYFVGGIAEVLVYTRAVSTEERAAIEGYLSSKYGLGMTVAAEAGALAGALAGAGGSSDVRLLLATDNESTDVVRVELQGRPGEVYSLEQTLNLADWSEVATIKMPSYGSGSWIQVVPVKSRAGYFRVRNDSLRGVSALSTNGSSRLPIDSREGVRRGREETLQQPVAPRSPGARRWFIRSP